MANNPYVNKVQTADGTVLIDLSQDTVTSASDIVSGKVGHLADGSQVTGTAAGGGGQAADFLKALCEDSADLRQYTEIPASPISIGAYEFYYKSNLALTSLPSGVTSIGESALRSCARLALTSLPSGVTSIGHYAFYQCSGLALTSLPSNVTNIGNYAFQNCTSLALTSLPSRLTVIGSSTFQSCSSLAITAIPDRVATISSSAFRQCTSLTELTIPASVTKINSSAFYGNTAMTAYHMLRTTPPTLSNANAFYDIPSGCKIYVPTGCLSAYQSASNWSTYASHMEEE